MPHKIKLEMQQNDGKESDFWKYHEPYIGEKLYRLSEEEVRIYYKESFEEALKW